jgi:hypothetical protein
MKRLLPVAFLIILVACGGGATSTPTGPSAPSAPAATTFALSGGVIDNKVNANKIPNAALTISSGTNSGASTTADGSGNYRFSGLTPGTFTITSKASGYIDGSQSVTLGSADKTQNLFMDPVPPPIFTASGTGDNVFTIPSYVTRIKVTGDYSGFSSNFIVHVAGHGLVNELIGTGWGTTHFEGTYLTTGGVTEILSSSGVRWTFTEVR